MARQLPSGTPIRSGRIWFPASDGRRLLKRSLFVSAAVALLLVGLYAVGVRRSVTPGDVVAAHAHINAKCSQCHESGSNVADARCARCHDTAGVGRLTNASHVLLGSSDPMKANAAPDVPCVRCHVDHRGAEFSLRRVDDRECASCHRGDFAGTFGLPPLTVFRRHPEFASVKAKRTTGVGLLFNHVTHFDYVLREQRGVSRVAAADARRASTETCQRCHIQNAEKEFTPVTFETGCAGGLCHTDRTRRFINDSTRDVTVAHLLEAVPGETTPKSDGDQQTKVFNELRHKEPWILANAAWIRGSLDPAGVNADRAALGASLAWLEQQSTASGWQTASADDLTRWQGALTREIADLQARLTAGSSSNAGGDLARQAADARQLVSDLSGQTDAASSLDAQLVADLQRLSAGAQPADDNVAQLVETRKRELLALLASVRRRSERSGDRSLADRADAIRARVERLQVGDDRKPSDLSAMRAQLNALDDVVKTVRQASDAQARTDLGIFQTYRMYVTMAGLGGVPPAEFEQRRQEIVRLLDAVERVDGPSIQPQVAALRARLATLPTVTSGSDDLRQRLADCRRLLERVQVELELRRGRDVTPPPLTLRDDTTQQLIQNSRLVLARLDLAAAAPAISEADRVGLPQTLTALLAPCLKCHLYDGEDENAVYPVAGKGDDGPTRSALDALTRTGVQLAPVSAAQPVLRRAVFKHAPHVAATTCGACHSSISDDAREVTVGEARALIKGSTLAIDFNAPPVSKCQECHKSGAARADCAACHVYHPASAGRLLQAVWSPN